MAAAMKGVNLMVMAVVGFLRSTDSQTARFPSFVSMDRFCQVKTGERKSMQARDKQKRMLLAEHE